MKQGLEHSPRKSLCHVVQETGLEFQVLGFRFCFQKKGTLLAFGHVTALHRMTATTRTIPAYPAICWHVGLDWPNDLRRAVNLPI